MSRYTTALMRAAATSPDLPAFRAALGDPVPEVKRSPGRYTLTTVLTPSLARGAEVHYRALADRRLAAVCLAARLYAVDHGGRLPARLEDLVPHYLPAVPPDPTAAGGRPLGYVSEAADPLRPRVYAVGADGTDDGGVERDPALPPQRGTPADEVRPLRRQPRP